MESLAKDRITKGALIDEKKYGSWQYGASKSVAKTRSTRLRSDAKAIAINAASACNE